MQAVRCVGQVGEPYSVVGPGGTGNAYAAMKDNAQSFVHLAAAAGLTFGALVHYVVHGETTRTRGTRGTSRTSPRGNRPPRRTSKPSPGSRPGSGS